MIGDETETIWDKPRPFGKRAAEKLARAMQVCGDVAKLYKKRGQPPKYISTSSETSWRMKEEQWQRREEARQARQKKRKP
jgi:hypothetical protein